MFAFPHFYFAALRGVSKIQFKDSRKENSLMFRLNAFARLLTFAGLIVFASACVSPATPLGAPTALPVTKIKVVATTTQVTALAKVVGGDYIELTGILPPGVDPHEYEPAPGDVRAFADAQLIVENGVGLEKWFDKVIQNSGTKAPIIDASKGVRIRKGDEQEPGGDPHIWHSAPNAIIMLNNIRDGLIKADPTNADYYKANAAAYEKKLNDLDKYIMDQIVSIPVANRKFVSNHDAFGYYVDRYGLTFVGSVIPSMDTSYEPSAKELADLVQAIKAQGVKAIFTESSVNPALSKQIAQDAGVRVVDGALYGDTLGPPGSGADTLDEMLKINTDIIVRNLK
jgi:zinc/manganese transport system substrate-binding protein/manganese/iron transport system substrate-binding protein